MLSEVDGGVCVNDILREFLLETHENLAQLDVDLISLEQSPEESETIARVFRALHTIKGTAGFLGLAKLQSVTHAGENLLSRLRAKELTFNAEIATALLGVVDAIRQMLAAVEATEKEGDGDYATLVQSLERLTRSSGTIPPPRVVPKSASIALTTPPSTVKTPSPVSIVADATEFRATVVADSSIRVDVGLLDKLMNLVGELVLTRNQVLQISGAQEDDRFLDTAHRLNRLTTELQAGVMKTRMQAIGQVWSKFPRLVRDLAVACEKQVRIDMDGQETELDKSILESIRDPLTHMVRNAVDHGIEAPAERAARGKPPEGQLLLRASHQGGKVIVEITDDGGGIDPNRVRDKAIAANLITSDQAAHMSSREMVNLVFLPGFSTADRVTQFSGRGVGMDVVRTNIEKVGGSVEIDSRQGQGTTVRMKIPLTLAIIPALTVSSGGDRYAIPQVSLLELVYLDAEQARKGIESVHGAAVYRLRGDLLPLIRLDTLLGVQSVPGEGDVNIVVLQSDDQPFGLIVDAIHDTEEIVVKPL
jgi:two-component system chemotaxis sensor kinase CheA